MVPRALGAVALVSALSPKATYLASLVAVAVAGPLAKLLPEGVVAAVKPWCKPLLGWLLARRALSLVLPDQARTLRVWRRLLPIVAVYMITKHRCDLQAASISREEVERRWAVRHEWGGQKVYQMIADIGGYYVKTAQILASKRELVPEQWCVRLSKLWDDLEPRPWPNVRASVASGLRDTDVGRRLLAAGAARRTNELPQAVFSSLQQAPLAAASIAQVHAAELSAAALRLLAAATTTTAPAAIDSCDEAGPASEGPGFSPPASASALASASVAASASAASVAAWHHGPQVVVKVQHADVRPLMSADLRNMGRVGRFLSGMLPFDVMPAIREMQVAVPKELDFKREARLMTAIRSRLHAAGFSDRLLIPAPLHALCGDGLLVQQRMSGIPFTSILRSCAAAVSSATPAANASAPSSTSGSTAAVALASAGSSAASSSSSSSAAAAAPDARSEQLRRAQAAFLHLLDAYGHMILVNGLFHADPHPGNYLLSEDGRLVLLDFGQCKALSSADQLALCRLFASLHRRDIPAALRAVQHFGLDFKSTAAAAAGAAVAAQVAGASSSGNASQAADSPAAEAATASTSGQQQQQSGGGGPADDAVVNQHGQFNHVDLEAVYKYLLIMFDTQHLPERSYAFGGGDVVTGLALDAFPGSLYLICRAVLILSGVCNALGLPHVSVAAMWHCYAARTLAAEPGALEERAAENVAIDTGVGYRWERYHY